MIRRRLNARPRPIHKHLAPHAAHVANTAPKPTAGTGDHKAAAATGLVYERFAQWAKRSPNATAVTSGRHVLSYGQTHARASALAQQLHSLGVGPEVLVGLCMRRSAALVVGTLGIFQSGGAYLPLDPSDPESRLAEMLDDAGVTVLVTEQSLSHKQYAAGRSVIPLDEFGRVAELFVRKETGTAGAPHPDNVRLTPRQDQLAYVIYTSGSTGKPKGVEITHGNLLSLVDWHCAAFHVGPGDRASVLARVGFDAGVWEMWPYLSSGASLHVPNEELLHEPKALQAWMATERITISFVPTPMAERMLALRWPTETTLRVMLTGGDTLHVHPPPDLPFRFFNNYGPTECTVVATSGEVSPGPSGSTLPPIGRPVANTQIYVLDESLCRAPNGMPGEIYIGGAGVGRGYRNRPESTAERFIANPFDAAAGRLFRTGDRARFLPDGQIAFLGRLDDQLKIRGFRIEPSEIVAVLNQHPGIAESAVVARDMAPDDRRLVAYLAPRAGQASSPADLREFLGARLPSYMVPATFVILEKLPLTANGKVDRAALPVPDSANTLRETPTHGPETEMEQLVAGILGPLLGVEHVDVEANFFALGGHSLLGIQLISRIRACLGVELSLRTVFESPSVMDLAVEIELLLRARIEAMSEDEVQRALAAPQPPIL